MYMGYIYMYIYIYIYIYINVCVCVCNPTAHGFSRPRGTGSVGDSVGDILRTQPHLGVRA